MAMCVECEGTGTIFGFGAMKIQCPICEGRRIVDYNNNNPFTDRPIAQVQESKDNKFASFSKAAKVAKNEHRKA